MPPRNTRLHPKIDITLNLRFDKNTTDGINAKEIKLDTKLGFPSVAIMPLDFVTQPNKSRPKYCKNP